MPSPFPGMDPFIEASELWGDFHHHLVEGIHNQLADAAPDRYVVRTGERSYMMFFEEEGKKGHAFYPDVAIADTGDGTQPVKDQVSTATAELETEAVLMRSYADPDYVETFVEIYEARSGGRLVTCLEVLSPVNKRPNDPGWIVYQRKRQGLMHGSVSLVEIDLLRGGLRPLMADPWPICPYTLLVARAGNGLCKVWLAHYRKPLPVIPVPLAKPDPDLTLDVQPLIARIYERSRYARSIDYSKPIAPPLPKADAAWLKRQLKSSTSAKGGRRKK